MKICFTCMWEWKIISISKAEHLTSFWYRGPGKLGNGLFNTFSNLHYIYNQLKSVSSFKERNNFITCLTKQLLNAEQKDSWAYTLMTGSLRKQPACRDSTTGFLTKCRLKNDFRNFTLMTCHYPGLGSASDWSCRKENLFQPIRSSTQI